MGRQGKAARPKQGGTRIEKEYTEVGKGKGSLKLLWKAYRAVASFGPFKLQSIALSRHPISSLLRTVTLIETKN